MRNLAAISTILVLMVVEACGAPGSTALLLQVKPEVALSQPDANTIQVAIRVRQGSNASVWSAEVCAAPAADAFPITRSGIYRIPLSQLSAQGASRVCLTSSDGSLSAELRLLQPSH